MTKHILNKLVGMGLHQATLYLEGKLPAHQLRLVREDKRHFAVTDDMLPNRHDVQVDNGLITNVEY